MLAQIALIAQTVNAQVEGSGELRDLMSFPIVLYGVEQLGAELARERVRWVSAIW